MRFGLVYWLDLEIVPSALVREIILWAVLLYTGRSMCQRLFSENTLYWVKKLRETNVIDSLNSEMIWAT